MPAGYLEKLTSGSRPNDEPLIPMRLPSTIGCIAAQAIAFFIVFNLNVRIDAAAWFAFAVAEATVVEQHDSLDPRRSTTPRLAVQRTVRGLFLVGKTIPYRIHLTHNIVATELGAVRNYPSLYVRYRTERPGTGSDHDIR